MPSCSARNSCTVKKPAKKAAPKKPISKKPTKKSDCCCGSRKCPPNSKSVKKYERQAMKYLEESDSSSSSYSDSDSDSDGYDSTDSYSSDDDCYRGRSYSNKKGPMKKGGGCCR